METIVRRDEGSPAKLPLIQDKQSCDRQRSSGSNSDNI
jgi:hypothetical protein